MAVPCFARFAILAVLLIIVRQAGSDSSDLETAEEDVFIKQSESKDASEGVEDEGVDFPFEDEGLEAEHQRRKLMRQSSPVIDESIDDNTDENEFPFDDEGLEAEHQRRKLAMLSSPPPDDHIEDSVDASTETEHEEATMLSSPPPDDQIEDSVDASTETEHEEVLTQLMRTLKTGTADDEDADRDESESEEVKAAEDEDADIRNEFDLYESDFAFADYYLQYDEDSETLTQSRSADLDRKSADETEGHDEAVAASSDTSLDGEDQDSDAINETDEVELADPNAESDEEEVHVSDDAIDDSLFLLQYDDMDEPTTLAEEEHADQNGGEDQSDSTEHSEDEDAQRRS